MFKLKETVINKVTTAVQMELSRKTIVNVYELRFLDIRWRIFKVKNHFDKAK